MLLIEDKQETRNGKRNGDIITEIRKKNRVVS